MYNNTCIYWCASIWISSRRGQVGWNILSLSIYGMKLNEKEMLFRDFEFFYLWLATFICLIIQEKCDMAAKEADIAKAAWLCRVCLSNEVDVTIVPCGHVLCRRCSSAVRRCPFCRLQVSKTIRIFRPWKHQAQDFEFSQWEENLILYHFGTCFFRCAHDRHLVPFLNL